MATDQTALDELVDWAQIHSASLQSLWDDPINRIVPALLQSFKPYEYQKDSFTWLRYLYENKLSGILGDVMGLGKTLQSISMIAHLMTKSPGPYLIVAPLSTTSNWASELATGLPSAKVTLFTGAKEDKERMKEEIVSFILAQPKADRKDPKLPFNVLITTPELILNEVEFLGRFKWRYLVFDEAHRLKNSDSALYGALMNHFHLPYKLLLTGTPIQNNMKELWSLLHFVMPERFPSQQQFQAWFGSGSGKESSSVKKENVDKLHEILRPVMLRRTLSDAGLSLPLKKEIIIYTGMTKLQKEYYRHVLTKNADALGVGNASSLLNVVAGLRKACSHPYLFAGAEKEPFEEGDHIFENSGKLLVLDKLLKRLKQDGHRVLIFCQFTQMMDILQDYLAYKKYTHERLDGSTPGDDRKTIISSFNADSSIFALLLSTHAGGQGLNLTGADTVIFYESDWNPQKDLQAAARVYRIGQTKPVEIIRLLTKSAIDEVIWKRSLHKMKLVKHIVEDANFTSDASIQPITDAKDLKAMIQFGLDELLSEDDLVEENIEQILSRAQEIKQDEPMATEGESSSMAISSQDENADANSSIYFYEGQDFSKDTAALNKIVSTSPSRPSTSSAIGVDALTKKRKILTEEEKAERAKKMRETLERKKKERESKKEAAKAKKWEEAKYESHCIVLPDDDDEELDDEVEDAADEEVAAQAHLKYLIGDASKPKSSGEQAMIILNCIDDSGRWSDRGFYKALGKLSDLPQKHYEIAAQMDDVALGDAHMTEQIDTDEGPVFVIHLIVQKCNAKGVRSDIVLPALDLALQKVAYVAKNIHASVHAPRLGADLANFNWYGLKKLLTKNLVSKGISTYIYYFRRGQHKQPREDKEGESSRPQPSTTAVEKKPMQSSTPPQASGGGILGGYTITFYELSSPPSGWVPVAESLGARLARNVSSKTTHLVTDLVCLDKNIRDMLDKYPTLIVVQSTWLRDCYEAEQDMNTG
eukprot:TRINITY_DN7237_c0_g1_i2.p1 TRINITY_DN7237_c0_g1~~TRINITY_DN7237_c0_g1_i2.p1  ORF type:complete len:988 (-),score=228.63 TRINITY_DN7237_c0_g1_i2:353-3316(-)